MVRPLTESQHLFHFIDLLSTVASCDTLTVLCRPFPLLIRHLILDSSDLTEGNFDRVPIT